MRYGLDMLLGDILEDVMCREAFEKIFPGVLERFFRTSGSGDAVCSPAGNVYRRTFAQSGTGTAG